MNSARVQSCMAQAAGLASSTWQVFRSVMINPSMAASKMSLYGSPFSCNKGWSGSLFTWLPLAEFDGLKTLDFSQYIFRFGFHFKVCQVTVRMIYDTQLVLYGIQHL